DFVAHFEVAEAFLTLLVLFSGRSDDQHVEHADDQNKRDHPSQASRHRTWSPLRQEKRRPKIRIPPVGKGKLSEGRSTRNGDWQRHTAGPRGQYPVVHRCSDKRTRKKPHVDILSCISSEKPRSRRTGRHVVAEAYRAGQAGLV